MQQDNVPFGRIETQAARQVMLQKVREAERETNISTKSIRLCITGEFNIVKSHIFKNHGDYLSKEEIDKRSINSLDSTKVKVVGFYFDFLEPEWLLLFWLVKKPNKKPKTQKKEVFFQSFREKTIKTFHRVQPQPASRHQRRHGAAVWHGAAGRSDHALSPQLGLRLQSTAGQAAVCVSILAATGPGEFAKRRAVGWRCSRARPHRSPMPTA